VSPLRGENPQNRPLSKLNNRHFALRAMLPVNEMPEYCGTVLSPDADLKLTLLNY